LIRDGKTKDFGLNNKFLTWLGHLCYVVLHVVCYVICYIMKSEAFNLLGGLFKTEIKSSLRTVLQLPVVMMMMTDD
jgi:hypothetical protein